MKTLLNIILLLGVMIFVSCIGGPTPAYPFRVPVYYQSSSGDDLLDPGTPGHFNKDSIKVSDLVVVDGTEYEIPIDPGYNTCERYVCQSTNTGGNYYVYICYYQMDNAYKGTLIHLNASTTDTLKYETMSAKGTEGDIVKRVIYKGKTVWENSLQSNNITIVR